MIIMYILCDKLPLYFYRFLLQSAWFYVIQANVQGRDMGSVVADIEQALAEKINLPSGYSIQIGGQFESQQRAQKRLAMVVPASLALIALLLYFSFGSVGQALLILVNVPLATIGGIFALYISGQYLSVPSSVGFITLFGVTVLNGVVMVASINAEIQKPLASVIVDGFFSATLFNLFVLPILYQRFSKKMLNSL